MTDLLLKASQQLSQRLNDKHSVRIGHKKPRD